MDKELSSREMGEAAARTFERWFEADHLRERYARAHRQAVAKKIEAGEMPDSYRADWVAETAQAVAKVLQEASATFDRTYPWDKAIVEDMGDVLVTAHGIVKEEDEDLLMAMSIED